MPVNWSLYEALLGNGMMAADRREVAIEESVNSFVAGMVDDPAYQKDSVVDGENIPIIASRSSSFKASIKAVPGTDIHIGDMVECFNNTWIVVELHTDKVGIINGEMWLCNNIIRFQNNSPTVNARHCVVNNGTYSRKTSDPDAFVMTNTYEVYITIDEATKKLFVDKRLAFGKIYSSYGEEILEVYKIIGMDVKSKNFGEGSHLMVLTLQRDVFDDRSDSLENNICDIYVSSQNAPEPEVTGGCLIAGRDTVRLGTTRRYTATFTNAEGVLVDDIVPIWNIQVPNGVIYTTENNICTVTVPLDENLVGEVIAISVTSENGLFGSYQKKVQVITVG